MLDHVPYRWWLRGTARVLDIGGADVNGTVHKLVADRAAGGLRLDVLDVAPGPGVTIVADAGCRDYWRGRASDSYDLVICTETFEHMGEWRAAVFGASRVLCEGGWFIGTCASVGRRPHGARGEHEPPEGEHYANIRPDDLLAALERYFAEIHVEFSRRPELATTDDLYWRARP